MVKDIALITKELFSSSFKKGRRLSCHFYPSGFLCSKFEKKKKKKKSSFIFTLIFIYFNFFFHDKF